MESLLGGDPTRARGWPAQDDGGPRRPLLDGRQPEHRHRHRRHDGTVVVAVDGEVDLCAAALFERSLAIARDTDAPAIVLDLDRVSFMDSAGLHVLLQFSTAERTRDRLSLTQGSRQVQRLLEITGVRRYLSFVRSPVPERNGRVAPAAVRLNRD